MNDKLGLRPIYIIYKSPRLYQTLKVKEFYLPVYKRIIEKEELKEDFENWKNYLRNYMGIKDEKTFK